MWIAEKLRGGEETFALRRGRVTIAGKHPAVDADGELRDVVLLAPAGMTALPACGAAAVVAPLDGDTALVGCPAGSEASRLELAVGNGRVALDGEGVTLGFGEGEIRLSSDGVTLSYGGAEVALSGSGVTLRCGGKFLSVSAGGITDNR